MAKVQKLSKEYYDKWTEFRSVESNTLNQQEQNLVAEIHALYFHHTFYKPCGCSPKQWNSWIHQINQIYENGFE